MNPALPVPGFAAYSGTDKTTLLTKQGLRIGIIKHAHRDFDIDIPGKDNYEWRKAGARQVLVASAGYLETLQSSAIETCPRPCR
jgi:molybdopterin-guanine dinucleotide biosynthesis protein MobB